MERPSRPHPSRPYRHLSDVELEALMARTERALFAGTSGHADMVRLIEAERELGYREAKRVRRTVVEERRARTLSGGDAGGWLSLGTGSPAGDATAPSDPG